MITTYNRTKKFTIIYIIIMILILISDCYFKTGCGTNAFALDRN